jgi:hypothetical protein
MKKVRTEAELGEAMKSNADTIEIEGDFAKKVIRIRATGAVAWAIALGAIGVAVYALLAAPATGGTTGLVGVAAAPAAVAILGTSVTAAAISIAVAGGGIGTLTKLRSYKEVSRTKNSLILKKK